MSHSQFHFIRLLNPYGAAADHQDLNFVLGVVVVHKQEDHRLSVHMGTVEEMILEEELTTVGSAEDSTAAVAGTGGLGSGAGPCLYHRLYPSGLSCLWR